MDLQVSLLADWFWWYIKIPLLILAINYRFKHCTRWSECHIETNFYVCRQCTCNTHWCCYCYKKMKIFLLDDIKASFGAWSIPPKKWNQTNKKCFVSFPYVMKWNAIFIYNVVQKASPLRVLTKHKPHYVLKWKH